MTENHQEIPETEDESQWILQLVASLVGLLVLVGGIAVYVPSCVASGYIEKRDEMSPILEQIKKAEEEEDKAEKKGRLLASNEDKSNEELVEEANDLADQLKAEM